MSGFLSSSYSPVVANLAATSSAWESSSLTLDKRDSSESKLTASSEKMPCLHETIFIEPVHRRGKPGSIKKWQRIKNSWKGLQKADEENKSFTLKLCQKKEKFKKLNTRKIQKYPLLLLKLEDLKEQVKFLENENYCWKCNLIILKAIKFSYLERTNTATAHVLHNKI